MGQARIEIGAINLIQSEPTARIQMAAINVIYSEAALWEVYITTATELEATLSYSPPGFGTTHRWTWPINERLRFETNIIPSHDRTEQRIALRQGVPARQIGTKLIIEGDHAYAQLEAFLFNWLKRKARVPLWFEAERYKGILSAGSSTIAIDTRYSDYREGAAALIWTSKENYEYVYTDSFTDSQLTLYSQTLYTHENPWIMPAQLGYAVTASKIMRYPGGALAEIVYEIEDVEAVSGFTAAMTYDGYTVLTDPANLPGDAVEIAVDPDVAILDDGCGPFEIVSNSDFNETGQSHIWHPWTKADCWWLRQFLHDIKGRQAAFMVPTFKDDLTITRSVLAGSKILYIKNAGIATNMGANDLRTYLAFRPVGSDLIVRKMESVETTSATEEKITLDAAPGQEFGPGNTLCWVDTCRLASDEINWTWHGIGKVIVSTPLIRITT